MTCRVCARARHTNTPVLSADEAARYTFALNVLAVVDRGVPVEPDFLARVAFAQLAVERLDLCRPELEMTQVVLLITAEGDLWRTVGEHIQDLAVWGPSAALPGEWQRRERTGDIAELVIVEDGFATLVTGHVPNSIVISRRLPA